jgi:uncharacterized membrane protein YedE/YeeE
MPIDPKKFREKVTNHFENIDEEKFLKNLHEFSPYLFAKGAQENNDIYVSNSSLVDSNSLNSYRNINDKKIYKDLEKIFKKLPITKNVFETKIQDIFLFTAIAILIIAVSTGVISLLHRSIIRYSLNTIFLYKLTLIAGLLMIPLLYIYVNSQRRRPILIDQSSKYRKDVLAVCDLHLDHPQQSCIRAKQTLDLEKIKLESKEKTIADQSLLFGFTYLAFFIITIRIYGFTEVLVDFVADVTQITDRNSCRNIAISLLAALIFFIARFWLIIWREKEINQTKYCLSVVEEVIKLKGYSENNQKLN